jgi:hypothetical protein
MSSSVAATWRDSCDSSPSRTWLVLRGGAGEVGDGVGRLSFGVRVQSACHPAAKQSQHPSQSLPHPVKLLEGVPLKLGERVDAHKVAVAAAPVVLSPHHRRVDKGRQKVGGQALKEVRAGVCQAGQLGKLDLVFLLPILLPVWLWRALAVLPLVASHAALRAGSICV